MQEVSPSTITDGEWDLLYALEGEPAELYRTVEDPGHSNNLIGEYPAVAEAMRRRFAAWLETLGASPDIIEPRQRF